MASTVINYDAPRDVNIGDVFYRVEPDGTKWFKSPCPVCEGTGSLTVNSYTFKCPCCDQQEKAFTVHNYVVKKYKVYRISQECSTNTWKIPKERKTLIELFRKTDRTMFAIQTNRIHSSDLRAVNPSVNELNFCEQRLSRAWYTDYKIACMVAQAFNDKEKENLEEYNKSHGTAFELPEFSVKNDKKESGEL